MLVFSASGNSGLVATCYGLRGLSAELMGTGRYQLQFPISKGVIIHPSLEAPSGVHYDLSIVSRTSLSGMAELHVGRGSGATLGHLKPVSGTKVLLRFSFHPRVAF